MTVRKKGSRTCVEQMNSPKTPLSFPVVGVGASAGGLEAFTQLLQELPVDTGMAFVLVQHLSPNHQSALSEILSQATAMPVTEVVDEPKLKPNCVYIIPPNRNMVISSGCLHLSKREDHGVQHPIDYFFSSLAENQRERSIGVVLSGTATDGTLGLEEIKAEGGITFAQDITAQHNGMPQSAVDSGCVDFVLSPKQIAREIARISTHSYLKGPYVEGALADSGPVESESDVLLDKQSLNPILRVLNKTIGVDFAHYKSSTLSRRIARRMLLQKIKNIADYERFIKDTPAEVQSLYQDLLINVTSFFRDADTFEALKANVIPGLLKGRSVNDPARVWVLGCSTGEEAYSLAMIFSEAADSSHGQVPVQIFATDLNESCIESARAGLYSKQRLHGVSVERQRRFFVDEKGQSRVSKSLRDMCVFAKQNVISDPPFSRVELISCRNLLIYIEPPLQQRIVSIFHYALKPSGFLVLGSSETVSPYLEFFQVEDAKHKIFTRKPGVARMAPGLPVPMERQPLAAHGKFIHVPLKSLGLNSALDGNHLLKEADRLLLERFAPPAVLIDANLNILQFRGNTEDYLIPAQGRASHALLKMARDGLLVPLQTLVLKAKKKNAAVREAGVQFKVKGQVRELNLEVIPVNENSVGEVSVEANFLVLFENSETATSLKKTPSNQKAVPRGAEKIPTKIAHLERELSRAREYVQSLVEQHDAANEELQSANEEANSANEELQSINEELETSKEEIQSSNEELTTVNDELQNRILESSQLNNDLVNLIESVQIAIVIVGLDLRIRRVSPMAEKLLNVLTTDLGRPITDIRHKIDLPELESLLSETINTVSSREREVRDNQGRWYLLRTRPYVTTENKIEGAVLLLLDVDVIRGDREYAESIVATVHEPLLVLDGDLCVRSASQAFCEVFEISRKATEGHLFFELGKGEWDTPELRELLEKCLIEGSTFNEFEIEWELGGLGQKTLLLNARRIIQTADQSRLILLAIEDITKRKRNQQIVALNHAQFEAVFEASPVGMYLVDSQFRILQIGRTARKTFGEIGELIGRDFVEVVNLVWPPETAVDVVARFAHTLETGEPYSAPGFSDLRHDRKVRECYDWQLHRITMPDGEHGVVCYFVDISARVIAESSLRSSELHYRRLFEAAKDGVLILDPLTRKILDANPFISDLLGYTQNQLIGKELFEIGLLKDEEASRNAFQELKEKGFIRYDNLPLQSKSGQRCEVEMVSNLYDEDGDTVIQCNIRDITERKRLQNDLRDRNEELLAADIRKNNFLAVLAHELRSPLNAIRGWVQLIQRPGESTENIRQGLEVIDRSSLIQAGLINDLLTGHRISSGKMRVDVVEIDLNKVITTAIATVSLAATEKDIRINCKISSEPVLVSGDANHLQQIFGNLLINAIKFTPPKGEITVAIHQTQSSADVRVADTGEGIAPDVMPHIFERFRQSDPSASRSHTGLGLGLSIAKQLIELHDGNISARSAGKGLGTEFLVSLPLRLAVAQKRTQPISENAKNFATALLGGIKVLVVDDDLDAREPLRRFLEAARAEVIVVGSTDEAIEVLRQQLPDVIVSDIAMPGRNGYDLIRSVRALSGEMGGQTPAIALTAYAAPADCDRALNAGFERHFAKPVDAEILISAIATLLGRSPD